MSSELGPGLNFGSRFSGRFDLRWDPPSDIPGPRFYWRHPTGGDRPRYAPVMTASSASARTRRSAGRSANAAGWCLDIGSTRDFNASGSLLSQFDHLSSAADRCYCRSGYRSAGLMLTHRRRIRKRHCEHLLASCKAPSTSDDRPRGHEWRRAISEFVKPRPHREAYWHIAHVGRPASVGPPRTSAPVGYTAP